MQRMRTVVLSNKAQCRKCGEVIESKNSHDFQRCKCGAISVDGGLSYLKRSFKDYNDIIELSDTYDEPYEADW